MGLYFIYFKKYWQKNKWLRLRWLRQRLAEAETETSHETPSFGHHNDSQRKYIFMQQDSMKTQSKSVKQVGKEWMSLFSNYNPVPKRQICCDVNCNYLAMTIIDFGLMSLSVQVNMIFKFNSRFLWDGALMLINSIENCRRQE